MTSTTPAAPLRARELDEIRDLLQQENSSGFWVIDGKPITYRLLDELYRLRKDARELREALLQAKPFWCAGNELKQVRREEALRVTAYQSEGDDHG